VKKDFTPEDELLFLALGGSGEIGMNVNLYGCEGKWIMVDHAEWSFAGRRRKESSSRAFHRGERTEPGRGSSPSEASDRRMRTCPMPH